MKVVLFCGGYGMRMRGGGADDVPKPMTMIGDRPLLWHVMRYYAHFGHNDFILCLGFGGNHIKDYFLHYEETRSNNFVLRHGRDVELLGRDLEDWTITFVQTGLDTPIGERLRRVKPFLDGEATFLANYADVLTDAPLDDMVARLEASDAAGCLLAVPPQSAFHVVDVEADDRISGIRSVSELRVRENGGYFVFRDSVFDDLHPGEDLVGDVLPRLIARDALLAYPYDGFWMAADTFKERAQMDALYQQGIRPWALWDGDRVDDPPPAPTAPGSR